MILAKKDIARSKSKQKSIMSHMKKITIENICQWITKAFIQMKDSIDLIQRSFTIAGFIEDDMIEDGLMEIEETNSTDEGIPLDDNEDDPIARDKDQDEVIEEELFEVNEPNFAQSMTRPVELHDLYKGEAIEEESNLNGWGEKMVIGFFS